MKKQIVIFLSLYSVANISFAQTNTTTGDQAGTSLTTGTHNSFYGYYSGNSNTTGIRNVFFGSEAGKFNTDGNYNVFIGYRSGFSNSGNSNVFIGYQSGLANTTGNHNFFLGNYSGISNTTGGSNVFIGSESGRYNTEGNLNTFIGMNSGRNNTTGITNTFIGNGAGKNNQTGSRNNFIGYESGIRHEDGERNVFIGNNSGNFSKSGSYNVFIGDASGHKNVDGNNNIFIGYISGYENRNGSGNVFIGNAAGRNEIESNKLYIENSSSNSPLIYGDFMNDVLKLNASVGIGIEPSYELDVDGTINATEILLNGNPISSTSQVWQLDNNDVSYNSGNVGIGTSNTFGYRLAVNGTIGSTEVKVENTSAWPDFVFEKDYELLTLEEVEEHITEKGHLPEIPSEAEVTLNGINLGEMDTKLLQKIEELTLYLIEQNKKIEALEQKVKELEKD